MASEPNSPPRISERRLLLTCPRCGWVHYAMTTEEMRTTQRLAQRYQMTSFERGLLQSAHSQCLRCESPASAFRQATASELALADRHLVTPVYLKSLPGNRRRTNAKPAKIAAQQSLTPQPKEGVQRTVLVSILKLPIIVALIFFGTRLSATGIGCFLASIAVVYSCFVGFWASADA